MALQGDYLGMALTVDELDIENVAYFGYCAKHDFHLQACDSCNLLRYPPTTACPWCATLDSHHAIQPAFKGHTPYMILLVDLDTQNGAPTPDEALRVAGNLCAPDGQLAPPEMVAKVGIGTRLRMVFSDVGKGLSLPQWTIDETVAQPAPWRYPD
jgi:uncharacterized OB-fold protein